MTVTVRPQQPLRKLACVPSPPDERDADFHVSTLTLPKAVKLPVQIRTRPPGTPWDQGQLGTCVGNGTGLACVVALNAKLGYWITNTPAQGEALAHDLYHLANPNDPTYEQGANIRAALAAAQKVGVLGYTKAGIAQRFRIKSYHSLLPSSDIEGAIEQALAANMVVVTGWQWPEDWMVQSVPLDTLPTPPTGEPAAGGHCVGIWRAAMRHPAPKVTSLVREHALENSWGKAFGPGGSAYFDAALEKTPMLFDAWVVQA